MKLTSLLLFIYFSLTTLKGQEIDKNQLITYLKENKVNYSSEEEWITDSIAQNNQYIFINENHGYKYNYDVYLKLIKEFKEKTDFTYILAETNMLAAEQMNKKLANGDTAISMKDAESYKGTFAWLRESHEFEKKLFELNQNYDRKIKYLGIDITFSNKDGANELNKICKKYNISEPLFDSIAHYDYQAFHNGLIDKLDSVPLYHLTNNFSRIDSFRYDYILNSMQYLQMARKASRKGRWDQVRDSLIFINFKKQIEFYGLQDEQMIGMWGRDHGYQEATCGVKWLANSIKENMNKKIFTFVYKYIDSKQLIPSRFSPSILKFYRSKKKLYYKIKISNDDFFLGGQKKDIKIFKKVTKKNSINLFYLNNQDSPYQSNTQLIIGPHQPLKPTIEHFQAIVLFRDSPSATPLGKNKN